MITLKRDCLHGQGRGDLGSWKGNLERELSMMFQDVGYHTFLLPNEMDFENLSYYAHYMKLLMVVSMKMPFKDYATKNGHIIGLCPYFSSGCLKLNISIIEGAHPQLQAIQFTKENIWWCCGDESQTKIWRICIFFHEEHSQKDFFTVLAKELTMD